MQELQGIAVSPGIAIGEALVLDQPQGVNIPSRLVLREQVPQERKRLEKAMELTALDLGAHRDSITQKLGRQYGAIFSAHLQMLQDPKLLEKIEKRIEQRYPAEYAVHRTLQEYIKAFHELDNAYMAERAHDLRDLEKQLLERLQGRQKHHALKRLNGPRVIVAHNLTPSETAHLDAEHVLGFVTEIGGAGGHTAIVAQGQELPAVVGVGNLLGRVGERDWVIVDGDQGRIILQPDEEALEYYRRREQEHQAEVQALALFKDQPAQTQDGQPLKLLANIEFPEEVEACRQYGADGVGLYRTEFLYLGSDREPTEQEQYQAYAQVVQAMDGQPVVIRTLDIGADKIAHWLDDPQHQKEPNPFLGLRSIRLSLQNTPMFSNQLRAILRASALGPIKIMFPLVITLEELRQAKGLLREAMEQLQQRGQTYDSEIAVGMMLETPSAAILLERFLPEVDFISIGTNDLVQYALAVDRSNERVNGLYKASDPAVLQLIRQILETSQAAGKPACLCGQMSGDPMFAMLLLGLGLRELSVPPGAIPEIKQVCRSVGLDQCRATAERALSLDSAQEVEKYLRQELSVVRRQSPVGGQ